MGGDYAVFGVQRSVDRLNLHEALSVYQVTSYTHASNQVSQTIRPLSGKP